MNKIIFFDADGVTVVARKKLFSQRLHEDYGVPTELVMPLFKNEFYKCVLGEMDLKKVLEERYLPSWGWEGTTDELLKYWWSAEEQLNTQVIDVIDKLRKQGARCYLATDQERYRAEYIMKGMGLGDHIDKAFFSSDLGLSKATPEYWYKVMSALAVEDFSQVEYWDDEIENVEAAKKVGLDARLYRSIEDLSYLNH